MTSALEARRAQTRFWRNVFLMLFVASLGLLVANAVLSEVRPQSTWGLGYGIAAACLLLLISLYGARRRLARLAARVRLGNARAWLQVHLYGGILFLLLVLMHSAFSVPVGTVTFWLWLLSIWTVVSGLIGLGLQSWLPRVLASGLETEVIYERIPGLVFEIRKQAEQLVEGASEPVQALYEERLAPTLTEPTRRLIFFADATGGEADGLRELRFLQERLPVQEHSRLTELARLVTAKHEIDAHYTLQWPLRWWLYSHVPVSIVLWALLILHVFAVLYY